jgi:hypothetical protein
MVHTTNKVPRSLAVLLLPRRVRALIAYATGVVKGMTGNPAFPSPTPSLASASAAIADLQDAEAVAMTLTKGAAATRDAKRRSLVAALQLLRIYVQTVADQDAGSGPAIIQSAGMAVKKIGPRPPRVFAAFAGALPGTVKIVAPAAGHRASYDWQYATDGATLAAIAGPDPSTTSIRIVMVRPRMNSFRLKSSRMPFSRLRTVSGDRPSSSAVRWWFAPDSGMATAGWVTASRDAHLLTSAAGGGDSLVRAGRVLRAARCPARSSSAICTPARASSSSCSIAWASSRARTASSSLAIWWCAGPIPTARSRW